MTIRTFLEMKILMMTTVFKSALLILVFSAQIFAQSQIDSVKKSPEPLTFYKYFNPSLNFDNNFFPDELNNPAINSDIINEPSSLWLRTRMLLNGTMSQEMTFNGAKSNILNPLYQQYSAGKNMRFINSILGSVSVGAAGYLAYRHLKKYGFLKKK